MKLSPISISSSIFFALLMVFALTPLSSVNAQDQKTQPAAPASGGASDEESKPKGGNDLFQADFDGAPTYIKANTLKLKSKERTFQYSGNVEVLHGDLTLTSNVLDGTYDEQNQIQQMIAHGNVLITRGASVRATGEQATYEKATETITLTENPELQQEDSVLTADVIRIYLNEDRSEAEGQVRVKLVEEEGKKGQSRGGSILSRKP